MATSAATIEKEIAQYVHLLNLHQLKTVLAVVKTLAVDDDDWWDELSETQVAAIRNAEQELDEGKGIAHAEVLEKYSKWL
jgi:predicted transcriptional regulator